MSESTRRRCNEAGKDLIREFEGFRDKAYLCPAGVWTIGYGHTAGVKKGDTCTEDEAAAWLSEDLHVAERAVLDLISAELSDRQFATLVSFTFNLGRGALRGSTLRDLLNHGDYYSVPEQLMRWTKATDPVSKLKVTFPGLVRRRAAECDLWNRTAANGRRENGNVASTD